VDSRLAAVSASLSSTRRSFLNQTTPTRRPPPAGMEPNCAGSFGAKHWHISARDAPSNSKTSHHFYMITLQESHQALEQCLFLFTCPWPAGQVAGRALHGLQGKSHVATLSSMLSRLGKLSKSVVLSTVFSFAGQELEGLTWPGREVGLLNLADLEAFDAF
jgi:hypothetical protein